MIKLVESSIITGIALENSFHEAFFCSTYKIVCEDHLSKPVGFPTLNVTAVSQHLAHFLFY